MCTTFGIARHANRTNYMTISEKLNETKEEIISNLETKAKNLERNRPKFDAHPEQLKAYNVEYDTTLKTLRLIHTRLSSYRVKETINYNCPHCWLIDGIQSAVKPRGGGTKTKDYWGCDTCDRRFEVACGI